ncbi:glutaredoxin family protein [Gordonia sp. ABSL1-1]|uniref:glutaredoxin family protein n=1 Tax=Gordonia sp. ABSL1-1 TaxID=3053923 RepID=UPI002573C25F|nr:glutaredoxin family protein [Gordonia sp. ABSL1-1]MDL9936112.1 glutaredoxin family protein [Gordonia sp. ABSL1-1]
MELQLLSRTGCSACATAHAELTRICAELGVGFTDIDVDAAAEGGNRELRAEYGDRLPVILLDGVEHSYWEVDEPRLRADLAARLG